MTDNHVDGRNTLREPNNNLKELASFECNGRGGKSHYFHIKNNLCSGLEAGLGALKRINGEKKESLIKLVEKSFELIVIYEKLMKEYPYFRKGELETERGYFPDIVDFGIRNGIENYIMESEKRLTGRFN
ncbi:hypothetical protein HYW75_02645 [Candidatus Pacearchaeota archaeon]|nr:hypothetical protein [Candidatus Pacearchaeota archaeon]